jgi:hypothetical protein
MRAKPATVKPSPQQIPGVPMAAITVTPEKFLQIVTRSGFVLGVLVLIWRLPEILAAIPK